jgi:hypothetical protein
VPSTLKIRQAGRYIMQPDFFLHGRGSGDCGQGAL